MDAIRSVFIIGSGNVATNLSLSLKEAGINISGIWSRNSANANTLAKLVDSKAFCELSEIDNTRCDLVIVAVSDDALEEVSAKFNYSVPVVHTSGTYNMSTNNAFNGVFYPLQTFTKGVNLDLKEVPFLIEADKPDLEKSLTLLASNISKNVHVVDFENRKKLHLSAVWINNFVTHIIYKAEKICQENEVPFEFLHSLLFETTRKAIEIGAYNAQTGPARRNDTLTIKSQLNRLQGDDKAIYELLTKSIIDTYRND